MRKEWLAPLAITLAMGGCGGPPPVFDCKPRSEDLPRCIEKTAGPAAPLLPGTSTHFVVDAMCEWNRSGVLLDHGGEYLIESRDIGEEKWEDKGTKASPDEGWTDGMTFFDPPARWFARARRIPMYALVASQGPHGPVSLASNGSVVQSKVERGQPAIELLVYANDWVGFYSNNHGCLEVTVRRVR